MAKVKYAVVLDHKDGVWGVAVPDLPGCFSSGNSYNQALENVVEAMERYIEDCVDLAEPLPSISPLEVHLNNKNIFHEGSAIAFVTVNVFADLLTAHDNSKRPTPYLSTRFNRCTDKMAMDGLYDTCDQLVEWVQGLSTNFWQLDGSQKEAAVKEFVDKFANTYPCVGNRVAVDLQGHLRIAITEEFQERGWTVLNTTEQSIRLPDGSLGYEYSGVYVA